MLKVRQTISLLALTVTACGGASTGDAAGQAVPDAGTNDTGVQGVSDTRSDTVDGAGQLRPELETIDISGTGTLTVMIRPANPLTGSPKYTADIQLPYRIAKYPVTVGDYEICVDAGACQVPSGRTDGCSNDVASIAKEPRLGLAAYTYLPTSGPSSEHLRLPVTCTIPAEAEAFCVWMGGRVARAGEWMHAARNNESNPFPWGDSPATPAQHPAAGTTAQPISAYEVGTHPASASWSGAQDFALTWPAELMGPESKSTLYAGQYIGLWGDLPGWLNGASPVQNDGHMGSQFPAIGFRCAWSK